MHWKPEQYYAHPALTRYFDHIQSLPAVQSNAHPSFATIEFDLDNAPAIERKAEAPKKKEKKANPVETVKDKVVEAASSVKAKATELVEGKSAKREKKEVSSKGEDGGKKKGGAAPKAAAAEDAGEPVPSMIDLRVGHIIDG